MKKKVLLKRVYSGPWSNTKRSLLRNICQPHANHTTTILHKYIPIPAHYFYTIFFHVGLVRNEFKQNND